MNKENSFCDSIFEYKRRCSSAVKIGCVTIGGNSPIVLQSMCTTDTLDTLACVNQACKIADAQGAMVRLTTQTVGHAENLRNIKNELTAKGYTVPLVADVHFNPVVAECAATIVDKVRINPGNFIDKRADFSFKEYTDSEYNQELERLKERFFNFLDICKNHGTAIRIGVNQGSLSDRIMSRYGDTPQGMTASAMEFLRLCKEYGFGDVVVSMKSSNTQVMIRANRMLSAAMRAENLKYPIHLGVTEAGEGEDGRIKSAVGIGALLNDGIGDTIRVSLTENPECEIPVARALADHYDCRYNSDSFNNCDTSSYDPYQYNRRVSSCIKGVGGDIPPVVIQESGTKADILFKEIKENVIILTIKDINSLNRDILENKIILFEPKSGNVPSEIRRFFIGLNIAEVTNPVIIKCCYPRLNESELSLKAAADLGMAFIDGMGDALWLCCEEIPDERLSAISFAILQASRVRMTKTEYISCPGCGRTLYDLQASLKEIKKATESLSTLKIAVMGCIVNGPGEMADADYGYVGSGIGKVNLYKGKTLVKRNIPQDMAVSELVGLIKDNGDWK